MKDRRYLGAISHIWWMPVVTGLIAIMLGVWTLIAPAEALPTLAYIFAGCLCGAGLLNLIYAFMMSRFNAHWGWGLVIGALDIIAGVWMFTLPQPQLTEAFVFIVGVWLLVVVINSICESFVMASYSAWWMFWMVLLLIASVVFLIIFLSSPIMGGIAVWLWLGFSLITYGFYRILLGNRIRRLR